MEKLMDAIKFPEFLESAGKELQARIERAGFYKHPTGIGDAREDVIRDYLQAVLPPRFSVDRGKVFDSEGRLSREFDVERLIAIIVLRFIPTSPSYYS